MARFRSLIVLSSLLATVGLGPASGGELRYGISMADIPLTTGQPDRGAGAYQFTGLTLYDPLVAWDMSAADRPGGLVPGLATKWATDPADPTKWLFTLRPDVKFHDGSAFDADAVICNFDKVLKKDAPQFDPRQSAQVKPRLPSVVSWRKVDAMTVEVTTKAVDSFFPYQMLWFLISSPAQWEKLGHDWDKVAKEPSGTGPFKLAALVPRERAELVRNDGYWNPARRPKTDKIVLIPIPEEATRTNALLSGGVDLIETPSPDAVGQLKAAGMRIVTNVTPHVWNYHLSMAPDSPWRDARLRKAANLAVDRDGVIALLNGLARPAKGQVDPASPWFGKPTFELKYDPDAARKLLAEAGYSKDKPLRTTFVIAKGGSGQMLSLPMNEFIQQNFADVGIVVDFKVVELETLYTHWRQGALGELNKGISANNIAYVTSDPFYALIRFFDSRQVAPTGVNWSGYANPEVDRLIDEAKATFDPGKQDALMARVHQAVVDDAPLVWVVHDVNPHALSPKVKAYTQAQHWFQDLTTLGD